MMYKKKPTIRVGGDAYIAPRPYGRNRLVYTDRRAALLSHLRDDEGIVPYATGEKHRRITV